MFDCVQQKELFAGRGYVPTEPKAKYAGYLHTCVYKMGASYLAFGTLACVLPDPSEIIFMGLCHDLGEAQGLVEVIRAESQMIHLFKSVDYPDSPLANDFRRLDVNTFAQH